MTEVKTTEGKVLFSFDESKTTLAQEIGKHKDLAGADIRRANLKGADLMGANLIYADLRRANLEDANLAGAYLKGAYLIEANLSNADLGGADLVNADLWKANISGANLWSANLKNADLRGAIGASDIPFACPEKGSFIAWKKVDYRYLVKLEIPEDARRSSATTNKCRCDKALVLDIEDLVTGEHPKMVVNDNYCKCVYEVGKMVYPDSFDDDRWCECSHGIHFFMDKKDAIKYTY